MTSFLVDALVTTPPLAEVFSDAAVVQTMLDVEAAAARVQARLQIIPADAAVAIEAAAQAGFYDAAQLAAAARRSATPVVPLVAALSDRVGVVDATHAGFVHWGLTSQDVSDTALVLTVRRSLDILSAHHAELARALVTMSDQHAASVMLGRTLLQPATPITFGLKVAGWYGAVMRSWEAVSRAADDALVLQCGGAAGTLAALGAEGPSVADALAAELGLRNPGVSWHAHRDRLAAVITALSIYTASLGKMARDVSLLMQAEVGEVSEPGGASSAMPHKRNPAGCAVILAAAGRMPGLAAGYLTAMIQEHERGLGGWQLEWPTFSAVMQTSGSALAAAVELITGLSVNSDRMRANLAATNGTVCAERVQMLLTAALGRERARSVIEQSLTAVRDRGMSFSAAIVSQTDAADVMRAHPDALVPERYTGVAEVMRQRLLNRCP
jgi:3-carboxy-cis,cis-muconate cycloisomerase